LDDRELHRGSTALRTMRHVRYRLVPWAGIEAILASARAPTTIPVKA
jgi:hypothetical protein